MHDNRLIDLPNCEHLGYIDTEKPLVRVLYDSVDATSYYFCVRKTASTKPSGINRPVRGANSNCGHAQHVDNFVVKCVTRYVLTNECRALLCLLAQCSALQISTSCTKKPTKHQAKSTK